MTEGQKRQLLFVIYSYGGTKTYGFQGECLDIMANLRLRTLFTGFDDPFLIGVNIFAPIALDVLVLAHRRGDQNR